MERALKSLGCFYQSKTCKLRVAVVVWMGNCWFLVMVYVCGVYVVVLQLIETVDTLTLSPTWTTFITTGISCQMSIHAWLMTWNVAHSISITTALFQLLPPFSVSPFCLSHPFIDLG